MRLGISVACYRWELYSSLQRTRKEYISAGYPTLYFSSVPAALPLEEGGLEWLIDHCGEDLKVSVLYVFSDRLSDADYLASIRDRASKQRLELILAGFFDWTSTGEQAEKEREQYVEKMKIAKALGSDVVNATHSDPLVKNHYTKDPPISTQIGFMKENFGYLAKRAEEMGLVIAVENHADYRCSEIAQVLEAVNSPSLRANLDTGNPVCVIEDPVEAAKAVARYAVVSHLKDYRILNTHMLDGAPRFNHAPTGLGDIDLAQILGILQREAPDPENLRLLIETVPPLEVDPGLWVRKCVSNVREMFGEYLTE
jgi:sugar phosphate isomerase/epimerase